VEEICPGKAGSEYVLAAVERVVEELARIGSDI